MCFCLWLNCFIPGFESLVQIVPLIQAGFCFVPAVSLGSAAGGTTGRAAPLLDAVVAPRKGVLGSPVLSLPGAQVVFCQWSSCGTCVTWRVH